MRLLPIGSLLSCFVAGLAPLVLRALVALVALVTLIAPPAAAADKPVVVGSKRFTEGYVLGEIVTQTLQAAGVAATHRQGLGNTAIVEQALRSGAIDVYAEYTGTIVREILKRTDTGNPTLEQLNVWLAPRGLKAAVPLGFNNSYALAMREADAARLQVDSLSALARLAPADAARLRLGLSHEFIVRADGWPALKAAYALPLQAGSGLDHGLAYDALARGQIDLMDVYSTDAKIGRMKLRVLQDDRGVSPRYDAVLLMRATLDASALQPLAGRIDEATMVALNAEAELDGRPFADVARGFLLRSRNAAAKATSASATAAATADTADTAAASAASAASATSATSATPATSANAARDPRSGFIARLLAPDLPRLLAQHLALVFGSLLAAVIVGVPLGVVAYLRPRWSGWLMGLVGMLQTVPSLALLAFLIALLGTIGFVPALLALLLYALLPIVRNTHAGLAAVPAGLLQAGLALGLTRAQVLRQVALPLATPLLLAGIKTAAVINVGTATVAAFIGAGGLGERIVSGLAVNDNRQMLAGAVPAALLAIAVQWAFDALEKRLSRR